jgi:hypothetical protein
VWAQQPEPIKEQLMKVGTRVHIMVADKWEPGKITKVVDLT